MRPLADTHVGLPKGFRKNQGKRFSCMVWPGDCPGCLVKGELSYEERELEVSQPCSFHRVNGYIVVGVSFKS